MKSANRRFAQKAVAVVVIVTMLYGAGVAPVVMLFVTGVVLVVFLIARRSQTREVEQVFDFCVAAEAILRDEDRRWYGFEVAEVIEDGEYILELMPDPPPVHLFALGALHHLIGNHGSSVEYLSRIVDDEHYEERNRIAPSPQLRRFVTLLRKIEAEPSMAPQTLGAVRSLERMRRRQAVSLLAEERKALNVETKDSPAKQIPPSNQISHPAKIAQTSEEKNPTPSIRPPIQEVLNDIYQDDQAPYN
jgi:hypothetical protein